jgi:hypothetical protein
MGFAVRSNAVRNLATTQMTYATPIQGRTQPTTDMRGSEALQPVVKHNLSNYISPVQLVRMNHDIGMWRQAVYEAEQAYYPQRIRMQRMYLDTALNGHVRACVAKRERLTTLRKFELYNAEGKVIKDGGEQLKKKKWFRKFVKHALAANFYGYSLIALGDIIDNDFPNLTVVRRWNVSPDRFNVTSYDYSINGQDFRADIVKDWHIYVDTHNENGTSPCGYGLFYNIAIYEIIMRNVMLWNMGFTERFSMPYVVAKTTKPSDERDDLEAAVANMGANGYAITDPTDEIEFLEAALAGTGWKGYDNLEARCQKLISKMILGHGDALDSTPGRLGADQGGDESPISKALSEVQIEDGDMMESVINEDLFPRLAALGLMDEGITLKYLNNDEVQQTVERDNKNNLDLANVGVAMKNAGLIMDPGYFQKTTGIPTSAVPPPPAPVVHQLPPDGPKGAPAAGGNPAGPKLPPDEKAANMPNEKIKNKLIKLYRLDKRAA